MNEKNTITEKVRVGLDELIICYSIVGHEHDAVIFEVEGYEE